VRDTTQAVLDGVDCLMNHDVTHVKLTAHQHTTAVFQVAYTQ